MTHTLNLERLQERCEELGYSQSNLAEKLALSRQAVSKWFTGKSVPRPAEFLKLGRLLQLRHHELMVPVTPPLVPVVAFRRRAACKTTEAHFERARDMGRYLSTLVGHLEVDPFRGPAFLKNPSTDYAYLQSLAMQLRREMGVGESAPLEFKSLIGHFQTSQAVLIPVLWGKKDKHENALHIYLPDSKTTWIYLNLDVRKHDFKFWMAHELGHVLTLDLLEKGEIDKAEDFADAFAGALLFPEPVAREAYEAYERQKTERSRIRCLLDLATDHVISPNSVYLELQNYAAAHQLPFQQVENPSLYKAIAGFNKNYPLVSESLFDVTPSADHFLRVVQENFGTLFYKALGAYVQKEKPGRGMFASLLGVSPMDADAYLEALQG